MYIRTNTEDYFLILSTKSKATALTLILYNSFEF